MQKLFQARPSFLGLYSYAKDLLLEWIEMLEQNNSALKNGNKTPFHWFQAVRSK